MKNFWKVNKKEIIKTVLTIIFIIIVSVIIIKNLSGSETLLEYQQNLSK